MQVVLNGVARSCAAIHVCGTNLFLKIEMCIGFTREEWNEEKVVDEGELSVRIGDFDRVPVTMNGETFYLFVGTMAYGALGVLIAFAGT